MKFELKQYEAELVIVGAGLAGICSAIQAAREGLKVALVNDRGVLGGNSSAEIGVFINGANDGGKLNLNAREGGIISEIMLNYKYATPARTNHMVLDSVLLDMVYKESNIEMFMNTCVDSLEMKDGAIVSVAGTQNTTESRWEISGQWFVDNTGDGALGAMAGAEYMIGREAKSTFNEQIPGEEADKYVLPSTLSFNTYDMGYKVPFVGPDFAFDIPETGILARRDVRGLSTRWFFEIGGDYDHVKDRELIIKDHKKLLYGTWDYLKNSGVYPECDTYDFGHIGVIPGTREYRRLVGDYVLTENDIRNQPDFEDTVGNGGWNIDLHAIKGVFDEDLINRHIHFDGTYQIPYRVCYSKNVPNMFMCGRCMSMSHVAFGSARVMATLSTVGQAVGMAAALCKKYDVNPRAIYTDYLKELQQSLLKNDQLVIGARNEDQADLAKEAKVTASSVLPFELADLSTIDYQARLSQITPQFKAAYQRDYKGIEDGKKLETNMGMMIPTDGTIETLQVCVKNPRKTKLHYEVCLPRKKENYGPDEVIREAYVEIEQNDEFTWIDIPVNVTIDGRYVLILFKRNDWITFGVGGDALPTTTMLLSTPNTHPEVCHISTMDIAQYTWERSSISPCFKTIPEQKVYEPENVINGYNRAYGVPNMWVSKVGDGHELSLEWDDERVISQLQITFAINTTKRFYRECKDQIFDNIATDYEVIATNDGEEKVIATVRRNHKKVNYLEFDTVKTDKITFRFNKTSMGQVGVYEVRAYE